MEENRNDIEILKAMIKENFEEQRKTDCQAGNGSGSSNQFQRQANAGQPGYAPDAESMRPDTDPLA